MKKHYSPKIVHVTDRHGDTVLDPKLRVHSTVREDLQALKRRPWDAPMATRNDDDPDEPFIFPPTPTRYEVYGDPWSVRVTGILIVVLFIIVLGVIFL